MSLRHAMLAGSAAIAGVAAWACTALALAWVASALVALWSRGGDVAGHARVLGYLVGTVAGAAVAGYVSGRIIRESRLETSQAFLWAANPAAWLTAGACVLLLLGRPPEMATTSLVPAAVLLAGLSHLGALHAVRPVSRHARGTAGERGEGIYTRQEVRDVPSAAKAPMLVLQSGAAGAGPLQRAGRLRLSLVPRHRRADLRAHVVEGARAAVDPPPARRSAEEAHGRFDHGVNAAEQAGRETRHRGEGDEGARDPREPTRPERPAAVPGAPIRGQQGPHAPRHVGAVVEGRHRERGGTAGG
jgi:hypothetical protein